MGTATDVKQLSDPYYVVGVNNTHDLGMMTPMKAMEVVFCVCFVYSNMLMITKKLSLVECHRNQVCRFSV